MNKTIKLGPNKTARIRGNILTVIEKESLTEDVKKSWYRMMAFMTAMIEEMDNLKGTTYYSARIGKAVDTLEKELELYQKAKTAKVWATDETGLTGDMISQGSEIVRSVLFNAFELAGQPPEVQERYQRDFINLTIKYGIAHPETFKQ